MYLFTAFGSPVDETHHNNQRSQKLKYLKIELEIITPDDAEREACIKSFLPSTKLAKVKMMIKRHLKINPAAHVKLSYYSSRVSW